MKLAREKKHHLPPSSTKASPVCDEYCSSERLRFTPRGATDSSLGLLEGADGAVVVSETVGARVAECDEVSAMLMVATFSYRKANEMRQETSMKGRTYAGHSRRQG